MKVSILKNESFDLLSVSTGYSKNTLEEIIIKRMIEEGLMAGDSLDCGLSVQQIGVSNDYDSLKMSKVLFPEVIQNPEVMELLDSIYFWGDGSNHPCPKCGCECEGETDSTDGTPSCVTWTNWKCTNGECDFEDSNEIDIDVLPGGYAYNSEN